MNLTKPTRMAAILFLVLFGLTWLIAPSPPGAATIPAEADNSGPAVESPLDEVSGQGFQRQFPHTGKESSCVLCHDTRPQKKAVPGHAPDAARQDVCQRCHAYLTDAHFFGIDPFPDERIRQRAEKAGNFFADGRVVCTSCHDPHGKKNGTYLLRGDYLDLCADSRAVNPHWNNYLCLSCHPEKPAKDHAPLREDGDINNLCNRCHHSEYARPDIHPVGVRPSHHIRIPADMPLWDGRVTCSTCHDCKLQMGLRAAGEPMDTNHNFLRKITTSRNTYCFHCHIEETYRRLNPHNQLDEQGEIVEETCLFCHAVIPDRSFIGPEKVSFVVQDPDEYCIGCHPGFTLNHPAGVSHLLEPSEKILTAIRTSVERIGVELPLFNGRIVCATCHNPHQEGVIQIAPAATGTERQNKLRLMPGRNQCTGCHWDK
ncbi:MAG TPA: hypothetical protein ENN06_11650 [Desulfobacteraceae bacterium]|nr:hypothetical protein [Desulfobacteraceae bacterium]